MRGITQGSAAITGVYVRNRLATGVYAGMTKLWPLVPGMFDLGRGTFQLAPSALQMQVGNGIALPATALMLRGQPLAFAANDGIALDMAPATFETAGRALAASTSAQAGLSPGHTTFTDAELAIIASAHAALAAHALAFNGAPLALSGDIAIVVSPGALTITGRALAVDASAAGSIDMGVGHWAFTPQALQAAAAANAHMGIDTVSVAGSALAVVTAASGSFDVGAGGFTFAAAAPVITASLALAPAHALAAFAGAVLGFTAGATLHAGVESVELTGRPLSLSAGIATALGVGTMTFDGVAPTVDTSSTSVAPSFVDFKANFGTSGDPVGLFPAAAIAGNYCLWGVSTDSDNSAPSVTGWTKLGGVNSTADGGLFIVYGKTLTSGDIAAGSVTATGAGTGAGWTTITSAWSGTDGPDGTATTNHSSANNATPVTLTATGLTTTQDNDVLVGFFGKDNTTNSNNSTFTPMTGFTSIAAVQGSKWQPSSMMYATQATAGASGNVTCTDTGNPGGWGAFLVALAPSSTPAAMTLTGALANGTVGVPYSSNLTLGGMFTASVTIDASAGSIPAWMTVTVTGNTVNFAGTPTTAETETFTPRATDSSSTPQVAMDPQSVTIAEEGSGPVLIGSPVTNGVGTGGGRSIVVGGTGTDVQAGDFIGIVITGEFAQNATAITDNAGDGVDFTQIAPQASNRDATAILIAYKQVTTDKTSYEVTCNWTTETVFETGVTLYQVRGPSSWALASGMPIGAANDFVSTPITVGPFSNSAPTLILMGACDEYDFTTYAVCASTDYNATNQTGAGSNAFGNTSWYRIADAALTGETTSISRSDSGQGGFNRLCYQLAAFTYS